MAVIGTTVQKPIFRSDHCHRLQRKPLISDPNMHHGTCVMHEPWCMSGSLTAVTRKTLPTFPAHAQPNFTYLARGPLHAINWYYRYLWQDKVNDWACPKILVLSTLKSSRILWPSIQAYTLNGTQIFLDFRMNKILFVQEALGDKNGRRNGIYQGYD